MTGLDDPPDRALCGARYRILGRIATGGMAEVLDGYDTILGRSVAIKVMKRALPPERAAGQTDGGQSHEPDEAALHAAHAADRMRVEARALALVSHPNVVSVTDFGTTTDARPFVVTERLQGASLDAELLARGFLRVGEATEVVVAVLEALSAAHAAGIVHRDVKPGNVFLCERPALGARRVVKLLDFGVAKIVDERSALPIAPAYETRKGAMVGTPKYMTPEQALGRPVDARTDVYAVGLLLYALVTGRSAFGGGDVLRIVEAMRDTGATPPSLGAPQPIPAALDAVVLRALAWRAEDRFQSAAAFAEALGGLLPSGPLGPAEDLDEATLLMPPKDRGLSAGTFTLVVVASAAVVCAVLLWVLVRLGGAGG
jgi:serine/threonine protein kinase